MMLHMFSQLTADATQFYGLSMKALSKLADISPKLERVVMAKCKGEELERLKIIVAEHYKKKDESLDEKVRRG